MMNKQQKPNGKITENFSNIPKNSTSCESQKNKNIDDQIGKNKHYKLKLNPDSDLKKP
jgi:hypothetical protein